MPALSFSAAPLDDATTAACAKVLEQMPVSLIGLSPRVVHTAFTVAWGNPAIVMQCGVAKPKDVNPQSAALFVSGGLITGPFYDVTRKGSANVYTTVDRAVYVALTIPAKYNSQPLPTLTKAIAKALPAVCSTEENAPQSTKCAFRK